MKEGLRGESVAKDFLLIVAIILVAGSSSSRSVNAQLQASRLSIWHTGPAQVNWPVIFTAYYNDSSISLSNIIFQWSFEGVANQLCTVNGRSGMTCQARTMEKSWPTASNPSWTVTLRAFVQGTPAVSVTREVVITQNFSPPGGVQAARAEIRSLTSARFNRIVNALYVLKANGVYNHFVYQHQIAGFTGIRGTSGRNAAHKGPAFLPWHRVFLKNFERALQVAAGDNSLGVPYWDWTLDASNPTASILWTNAWYGPNGDPNNGGRVMTGPFCSVASANCAGRWPIPNAINGPVLRRALGSLSSRLPTGTNIANIRTITTYDASPYDDTTRSAISFRQALEGWQNSAAFGTAHNNVHNFVGGSMSPMTSPNDPVFFFHHCNVDKIWWLWQRQRNCYSGCYRPFANDSTITSATPGSTFVNGQWRIPGHQWGDVMFPWNVGPANVADAGNSLRGYFYVTP